MSDPSTRRAVEYVRLDDVRPADRNPKTHARLAPSFARFGFVEPMIRDDRTGRLVAGHGRLDELRAARARDATSPPDGVMLVDGEWHVPLIVGWSSANDDDAQAYVVASNRLVELGGWDQSMLAETLDDLMSADALDGIGYTLDETLALLNARIDEIADELADTRPQLDGMTWRVVVDCDDEEHQAEVLGQLDLLGLRVRAVVN